MLSKLIPPDPCGEKGTCLVKASCKLPTKMPWERTGQCPEYKKYVRKRNRIEKIQASINAGLILCSLFLFIAWIAYTFFLGLWEQYVWLKNLF